MAAPWGRLHKQRAPIVTVLTQCSRTAISGRALPQYSLQDVTVEFYCHCLQETTFLEFVPSQPDSLEIYDVFCIRYYVN